MQGPPPSVRRWLRWGAKDGGLQNEGFLGLVSTVNRLIGSDRQARKNRSDSCVVHGKMSEECRSDLRQLWGHNRCTCGDNSEHTAIRRDAAQKGFDDSEVEYCCYLDPESDLFQVWCSCGRHKLAPKVYIPEEAEKKMAAEARRRRRTRAWQRLQLTLMSVIFAVICVGLGLVKGCIESQ
jgi:hypothetical protein